MQIFHYLNYIDPGTGSMLFTIVIGIATTLFFVLRGLFIKFKFALHGGNAKGDASKIPLVIYTDSKRYWNVFQPICDELEKRQIRCEYWTASSDDPVFQESYSYISPKFIGEGNKGFARLNVMNAHICLATTPGLDYYDAVLATGPVQIGQLRQLEAMRGTTPKEIEVIGSTCLDSMLLKKEQLAGDSHRQVGKTVLCAPSWGPSSILSKYGEQFVQGLLDTGYHIIIRPHPQSKTSEAELLNALQMKFPPSDQLEWNEDNDNFQVLSRSDILISDFSGVIFDFCYIFDRPVIYADTEFDKAPYDADWLEETPWLLTSLEKIGRKLEKEDIPRMKQVIDEVMEDVRYREANHANRPEIWEHVGEVAVRTVDYLQKKTGFKCGAVTC